MKLSIVVPFYNEELLVRKFYNRLTKALKKDFHRFTFEFIFIDDGSLDTTFDEIIKLRENDNRVKGIKFSRNFGHHIAITAGLDIARGDYTVIMDGDLQDRPEEIISLYQKLKEGYDVVYAVRMQKKFNIFKRFTSQVFNLIIKKMIHEQIVINSTIFRIMTKQVVTEINKLREQNRYIVGVIGWVGFSHASQPVIHGRREDGKTKYTLNKQINLAMNAIFAYSAYPLQLFINLGVFIILIAFFLIVLIIIQVLLNIASNLLIQGFIALFLFMGGLQIILLSIIGEYVGRNYIENKNRPLYIIKQQI